MAFAEWSVVTALATWSDHRCVLPLSKCTIATMTTTRLLWLASFGVFGESVQVSLAKTTPDELRPNNREAKPNSIPSNLSCEA